MHWRSPLLEIDSINLTGSFRRENGLAWTVVICAQCSLLITMEKSDGRDVEGLPFTFLMW